MKLLTRDTDYAVRAICYMASRPGRLVTVTELVNDLKIPRPFLRKILQVLNKAGIAKSVKGSGGGFRLVSRPDKLTLADLMEVFQGRLSINECAFKRKLCPNTARCVLKRKIDDIENYVEAELRSILIGSLLSMRSEIRV